MFPGNQDDPSVDKVNDPEEENRSFHGRLLDRGQTCLPVRKRDRLAKLAKRDSRALGSTRLARFIGEGAILAGGLALGAGIMRVKLFEFLKPDDDWKLRTGLIIAVGLGCLLLSIVARLMARPGTSRPTQAARG